MGKLIGVAVAVAVALFVAVGVPGRAWADEKPNSCGCYQDGTGACFCSKKAKCGCPGSCEPKGCEEKREKELRKEIDAETRKAQNAGRRAAASEPDKRAATEDNPRARESTASERKPKTTHLTAPQRKELLHLLDLYAAEHGDRVGRTVEQVRSDLTSTSP